MHCIKAHALFVSLQLDWATMIVRLLGPTTCLPRADGGILLSALPKDTTGKLAGLFSTLSFFYAILSLYKAVHLERSFSIHSSVSCFFL